jgi:polar amino acid transport system permease protein
MKVWNWEGFWGYFTNLYLLEGALWTIGLTVSTLVFGGLIGLLLAVMRLSKHKALSRTSQGYVWIFRGTPLLVQLIIIYTGLPQLGLVRFTVLESAVIGLALNEAAYLSEILRGGILSVAKGQTEAARALGLKPYQIFRKVVLPQALRVIIPPLTNQYLNLTKNSSLAVAIGYPDLVAVFAGTTLNQTNQAVEIIAITMAVYLAISLLTSIAMNWYNARIQLSER